MHKLIGSIFAATLLIFGNAKAEIYEPPGAGYVKIWGTFNYSSLIVDAGGTIFLKISALDLGTNTYKDRWIWIDATTDSGLIMANDIVNAYKSNPQKKSFAFLYSPDALKWIPDYSGVQTNLKLTSLLYTN
jgi:hypothetical protein